MTPWLAVVGIGEDGVAGLTPGARRFVDQAEVLVGGTRHLALIGPHEAERIAWRSPLTATIDDIRARRSRRVVVLASGDPLWFGAGATLLRHFAPEEIVILPQVGAFSLAAARLSWPLAEISPLTLHGRPVERLALHFVPGARMIALSEDRHTPAAAAKLLVDRGWGPSRIIVLEHLGGPQERRFEGIAETWSHAPGADLNTLAIECRPGRKAQILSRAAGLPDHAFIHDGQLTKREVRAATLAALAPFPGQTLWDIGAGCGSIAIEWLRLAPESRVIAVERDAARRDFIARNAAALGVPQLEIVAGEAPAVLAGLPPPDAIFVGGGLSVPGVLESCRTALPSHGRLVANAITVESEAQLLALHAKHGGQLTRIAISRAEPVGPFQGWRPLMPVTQWTWP